MKRRNFLGKAIITLGGAVTLAGCGSSLPEGDIFAVIEYTNPPTESTTWYGEISVDGESDTITGGVSERWERNVGRPNEVEMAVQKTDDTSYDLWIALGTDEETIAEDETDEPGGTASFSWSA